MYRIFQSEKDPETGNDIMAQSFRAKLSKDLLGSY